jgi:hypothetical protein
MGEAAGSEVERSGKRRAQCAKRINQSTPLIVAGSLPKARMLGMDPCLEQGQ